VFSITTVLSETFTLKPPLMFAECATMLPLFAFLFRAKDEDHRLMHRVGRFSESPQWPGQHDWTNLMNVAMLEALKPTARPKTTRASRFFRRRPPRCGCRPRPRPRRRRCPGTTETATPVVPAIVSRGDREGAVRVAAVVGHNESQVDHHRRSLRGQENVANLFGESASECGPAE
jgi:hypothetical protein